MPQPVSIKLTTNILKILIRILLEDIVSLLLTLVSVVTPLQSESR